MSDFNEFGTRVHLKSSNDRGEFELDRARSKNNIAKNLFALGHETDNSSIYQTGVLRQSKKIRPSLELRKQSNIQITQSILFLDKTSRFF